MAKVHFIRFRVRYAEVDRMGQVHSSRFPVYMEMGRTEMLRATGLTYRGLEAEGVLLVVARLSITWHQPARYDDVLILETTLDRATTARIDHGYRFTREGVLLAEGKTTLACVSADGRPRRLPGSLLEVPGLEE